ncbi:2-(3-amino-3-carboxypropyl)histidine synthase subunit 2 isoform X2 [Macadamia integrifolia]|uniref:2-(3-amino-3-carboxypropyl)histidine synthase subunit 2 isoform X2 n=1 Tax=Macadamia integrifolia TaxID=60698 RepID=UPI001C4FD785|nr:2-(3-amino-3-carboxypropyl)histidine synthase subunit 2 isoform X2 [Macadamia integrifolia]
MRVYSCREQTQATTHPIPYHAICLLSSLCRHLGPRTSTLPALFVFGKASICVQDCVKSLSGCLLNNEKPILVLFGLEYAHAIDGIKEALAVESTSLCGSIYKSAIHYADVLCSVMNPTKYHATSNTQLQSSDCLNANRDCAHCDQVDSGAFGTSYTIGGLTWNLPEGHKVEDCMLFWIGSDNAAFANVVLTYNRCDTVRYDPMVNNLVKDVSHMTRIIKRRYYLVEKAKDANIVGILVGTLAVAGYLHMIHQMKELITGAGKKAYTLVMGRPNPAKLANFPECDVFVYVSCAQTALLDSKEFLAPVITPFEAFLAFSRGSQWTGEYVMEFRDLIAYPSPQVGAKLEARFSFLQGGYMEDLELQESEKDVEENVISLTLAEATEKSLQVHDNYTHSLVKGKARTGAEFFAARSYHGLDIQHEDSGPRSVVLGRSGKASGYSDEKSKQENVIY